MYDNIKKVISWTLPTSAGDIIVALLAWQAMRGTRIIWLTILVVTAAQFAVTYLAPFQRVLNTAAVSLVDGKLVVAIGAAMLFVCEIEKQIRLRLSKRGLP